MNRAPTIPILLALAILATAAQGPVSFAGSASQGSWREIAWPFPRDGWPAGRAVRCDAEACGFAIEIYVRPKLGFCNCDTGVADDDEVDRVADIDLISPRFSPREAGRAVTVAGMTGRQRSYDLAMPDGTSPVAFGIAVSRRCDLLVAVAKGRGDAKEIARVAIEFLESPAMRSWMVSALDGR